MTVILTQAGSAVPHLPSRAVASFSTSGTDRDLSYPLFQRIPSNPVFDAAQTPLAKIYWPWLVKLPDGVPAAYSGDRYHLYFSTDHDDTGGIYVATASSPLGPFTYRGRVFLDTASGGSTETPSVIWNEAEQLFFLYYQQNYKLGGYSAATMRAGQQTLLATSPDGVTWTRVGPVLDMTYPGGTAYGYEIPGFDSTLSANKAHTGYLKPHRIGGKWFAWSLYYGGNIGAMALSHSRDGRGYQLDHNLLHGEHAAIEDMATRWNWHETHAFLWQGRLWAFSANQPFISGSTQSPGSKYRVAPLASNLRKLAGKALPALTFPLASSWETDDDRGSMIYTEGGRAYLIYQLGQKIGVAIA